MVSTQTTSRLTQLASSILKFVAELEEKLSVQGYPSPSFDEDAPALFPKDAVEARDFIIDSAAEIQDLLQGPLDLIYRHGSVSDTFSCIQESNSCYNKLFLLAWLRTSLIILKFNNCVSIQAISRFNIAALVPPGGRTTYVDGSSNMQ